jgi:hypothetical protein
VPASSRKVLLPLLAAVLAVAPLAAQEPARYLVLLGGKRAGTQTETFRRQPDGTLRTESILRIAVKRFGQSFTVTERQSWVEGQTLQSVDSETEFNGEATSLTARLQGEDLLLKEQRGSVSSEHLLPQTGPLLGPRGAEDRLRAALAEGPVGPGLPRELSFRQFSPETGKVHEVHLRLLGAGELVDSLGALHRGQRVDMRSSTAPGVNTETVYDEAGLLEYSITRVGVALEVVRAAAGRAGEAGTAGAADSASGETSDLERFEVASLAIPVRWPSALQGPDGVPRLGSLRAVTLRFTGPAVPELEQAAREERAELGGPAGRRDGQALLLELSAPPPPPAWPRASPAGGEFTGGGFYLDLGDPRLEELAAACAPPGFACLERLVDRTIRTKSLQFGFAGVREVLDSESGDCTEHALLLAALLRKRGVPARIAYGFLLSETGFIGHAWTEARAEAGWFTLDPSFPGGQPYGFKLRLGVIDPAQPVWGQLGLSLLAVAGGVQAEVLESVDGR